MADLASTSSLPSMAENRTLPLTSETPLSEWPPIKMIDIHLIEDVLPKWRKGCSENVAIAALNITKQVLVGLPDRVNPNALVQQLEMSRTIRQMVTQFAVERLLPLCVNCLLESGRAPDQTTANRIRTDAAVALRKQVPDFKPYLPPERLSISYKSWIFAAAGCAALGCLAFTPLSQLLLGQREPGLLIGGIAGAGIGVGLLAWLAERPKARAFLEKVLLASGIIGVAGGLVSALKGKPFRTMLKTGGGMAGGWVLLRLVRPQPVLPTREECQNALQPQVERSLDRAADLVLAVCWSHPKSWVPAPDAGGTKAGSPIPDRVADALELLSTISEDQNASDKNLRGAVRSLLQRVADEGYTWQTVPDGTQYDVALADRFHCFGTIQIGQPVETLKRARLRNGKPDKPGELRAL